MPVVINEIVIKSPPPVAQEPYLRIKLEDTLVSSWQTSAADAHGGQIHIESFSWGISQTGAHASAFEGRFLTARDLTGEQDGASAESGGGRDLLLGGAGADRAGRGETTLGDIVVVKQLDKAAPGGAGDDLLIGGTTGYDAMALGDGSVRFVNAGLDSGIW